MPELKNGQVVSKFVCISCTVTVSSYVGLVYSTGLVKTNWNLALLLIHMLSDPSMLQYFVNTDY